MNLLRCIPDALVAFVKWMLPPRDNDPEGVFRWRAKLCGLNLLEGVILVSVLFVALGGAQAWGVPGVATTDDLTALAPRAELTTLVTTVADIQRTQRRQISETFQWHMRDLRLKYCASKDGLREEMYSQLQAELVHYQTTHGGQSYPMSMPPDCPN